MNYSEIQGYLLGISNKEFEILLNLAFTIKGFQIESIRRDFRATNDFLLNLSRVEKKGFLRKSKKVIYLAHIDRKLNEYSNLRIYDFLRDAGLSELETEKIFILNMKKIKKPDLDKSMKKQVRFISGKKFFEYLFRLKKNFNFDVLESLYFNENQIWDKKTSEEQKEYCDKLDLTFNIYDHLWKYPVGHQVKLISSIQDDMEGNQKKENYDYQSYQEKKEFSQKINNEEISHYEILGLPKTATFEQIKNAFHEKTKTYHPDKSKTEGVMMRKIIEAYEVLKDPDKKREYDNILKSG